jgi:hypothetical protein
MIEEEVVRKLKEAYEWGYSDGQNNPNGYSEDEERDRVVAMLIYDSNRGEVE